MEHSYLGDLEMKLTCPNGNFVSILNMYSPSAFGTQLIPGGCGSGIGTFLGNDTNLDGGAIGTPIITYAFSPSQATFGTICSENTAGNTIANAYGFQMMNPNGVYLPDGDFNDLIGCPINGTWTITIQDNQGIDDGYIASWGIKFNESNTFWDNNIENNVPFFVSETTTYTLTGIDSLGCQDTDQIIVSVNAPSDTTIIITADNSFSLNNIQYTESGIYNQSLTNIFGCDSTITIDLTVLDIGATNINQSSINVYPNPTNDVVSIVSSIVFLGKEYQLLDQAGRELVKGQFTAEKTTISLKHLASGIYFLKAKDSQPIKIVRN
jgi:subtilisin-like proprotein convertase family protein